MPDYMNSALCVILEFGRPERRGRFGVPPKQDRTIEELMKEAGYLTSTIDESFGMRMVHYVFTEKAWNLYRSLKELEKISEGAQAKKEVVAHA